MNDDRSKAKAYIARNKNTGFHYAIEVIEGEGPCIPNRLLYADELNSLVSWESLKEFVTVLETTGPLLTSDLYRGERRCVPISEFLDIADNAFIECEANILRSEMYLDGRLARFGDRHGHPSLASCERDVRRFGFIERNGIIAISLLANNEPGLMVAIEPIMDHVFIRNIASVLLRLIASARMGYREVDAVVGMRKSASFEDLYLVPIAKTATVGEDLMVHVSGAREILPFRKVCRPLLEAVAGSMGTHHLTILQDDGYDCVAVTAQEAELAARKLYESCYFAFKSLHDAEGDPIGWEIDHAPDPAIGGIAYPEFYSLAGVLIGSIFYFGELRPTLCKKCGTGFMDQPNKKQREFCSATCRVVYSKQSKRYND